MCDYSLQSVRSRPAQVGEKLTVRSFGTGTNGFASSKEDDLQGNMCTAICLLPGTEIAFDKPVETDVSNHAYAPEAAATARFRQINKDQPHVHHDALDFGDGKLVLLTFIKTGQKATVLQLPAAPKTDAEAQEQTRLEVVG